MNKHVIGLIPGFKLSFDTDGPYELVCNTDGARAIRRVGRFTCPICGSNVSVAAVKTVTFGLLYGGRSFNIEGTMTGRTRSRAVSETFRKVYGDPHTFNYPIQGNFAELEMKTMLQQNKAASALPNHEEELSEKDDDAGRNYCPGSCLCKSNCSDHSKEH